MGADEYHPLAGKGSNLSSAGGIGYTVLDAIDTMLIMGLDAEYLRARNWVEGKLTFDREGDFNTFEVRPIACLHVLTCRTSIASRSPFVYLAVC